MTGRSVSLLSGQRSDRRDGFEMRQRRGGGGTENGGRWRDELALAYIQVASAFRCVGKP